MKLEIEPAKIIVDGYLPAGLALLASRPKIGKSWLMLLLSMSVAMGGKFLDREVEQGEVLYLALEDNMRRMQHRLGKLLGPGEQAPKGLTIANRCNRLGLANGDGGEHQITKWLDAHPNARLVIIDT